MTRRASHSWCLAAALFAALHVGSVSVAFAASDAIPTPFAIDDEAVKALALKWFADMQTGQIDRSQLTAEYSAQLDDTAVRGMANYLRGHAYGAPPRRAEIVMRRKTNDQSLYVVKLIFPRGDAASLLIGLSPVGKITGVSLMSMAGD